MLNITRNKVQVERNLFPTLKAVEERTSGKALIRILIGMFIIVVLALFLPWTQNIRAKGNVTTLKPDQRPQTIHSIIDGRIEKWYVQEGDFVAKGDTILFISEVKDDYFDTNYLDRTGQQILAKEQSVRSYEGKVVALSQQIQALKETAVLKLEQARNKLQQAKLQVTSDSIDYQASLVNYDITFDQFKRMEALYQDGLKSLTDLENRKNKMQKAQAEKISYENKLLTSQNKIINAQVELSSIRAQYNKDIADAKSKKYEALSGQFDAEATVTKLENQYSNISVRTGLYYITAAQDGYITKAIQSGIGETVKAGTAIVSIMPSQYALAVQMYIKPIDLPLLERGQHVRIQFDGWPAIVFSGWPNTSYGTYGGQVFAIDNFISDNGMFRVLVAPDPTDNPWPDALRVGGGSNSMLLLKEVPIWYEIWRQINGFPPDYYKTEAKGDEVVMKK